jgi:hypothetical protein
MKGNGTEDGRAGVLLLDEVFQLEQVGPRGRIPGRARQRDAVGERRGPAVELPRTVALGILHEGELAGRGGKSALRVRGDLAGLEVGLERRPVEAKVGRDARVLGDTQIVLEEEGVDGGHGNEEVGWPTEHTEWNSGFGVFRVFRG